MTIDVIEAKRLIELHANVLRADGELTSYLSDRFKHIHPIKPKQALWHIINDQNDIPTCANVKCSNQVKWNPATVSYRNTCGYKCSNAITANDDVVKQKRKDTNIVRYGGTAPACSEQVRNDMNNTLEQNYGPEGMKHVDIQNRKKQTCLEKYGVDNPSKSQDVRDRIVRTLSDTLSESGADIREARMLTNNERYGVNNPMQSPEIHARAVSTNQQLFGVDNVLCKDSPVRQSMHNTMMEKYGDICYARSQLSEYCKQKLSDATWLKEQHHTLKRTICDIAQQLDIDPSSLTKYFKQYDIELLRFGGSQAERDISEHLTDHGIDHHMNDRNLLGGLELDIVIPSFKLAIEYCGLYWHSTAHERIDASYHLRKLTLCEDIGYRLITIFEDEWDTNHNLVLSKINHIIGIDKSSTIYARKCSFDCEVTPHEKSQFFNNNHIQGTGPGSVTIALEANNVHVAMMTFIIKGDEAVLNRYATSCNVVGGFSKLLKHFIKANPTIRKITSFADRRWSQGGVYEKCGFTCTKVLPPDYRYVVGPRRIHKFNYRRKHLPTKLIHFDPSLSEKQNTELNGIYRIYDCGLFRYTMEIT